MTIDLIIKNALIVSCDANHTIISDGAICVHGRNIVWVGRTHDLDAGTYPGARIIDAKGRILMPGLINMHAHCGDSLFRGLVENLPLEPWLNTVWKAQAAILGDAKNCRVGAELGMAELLLGGTTCVMDMFWHPEQTFLAAKEMGMRIATGGIFFDPPGMDGSMADERAQQAQDLFDLYGEDDEVFVGTLPHGTYTVGPDNIKIAVDVAKQNNGFFCTHAAETEVEQNTIQEIYGTRIIAHLHGLGALSDRTILAHCVHLDEHEIDLLAESGTHVVHNPLSNMKLASGFAPITAMQEKNINITLGTDGAISGNDLDMWLAMRLTATIHKAFNKDPTAISTEEVLHMATLNGAKALGAKDILGSIEAGKRADFILLDIDAPHAMPMFNPINHLVYSASKADVSDVFISGRQVVRKHRLHTYDLNDLHQCVAGLQPKIVTALEA